MKKIITILVALISVMHVESGYCQSVSQMRTYYNQMVQLNSSGQKELLYETTYNCYLECVSLLESLNPNTAEFLETQDTMRSVWTYLINGASYYQTATHRVAADIFRAVCDIVEMEPMAKYRETLLNMNMGQNGSFRNLYAGYFISKAAQKSFLTKDYYNAIKYSSKYLELTHSVNQKTFVALQNIFLSYEALGEYDKALRTIDKAISLGTDPNILLKLYNQACNICRKSGEFSQMEGYLTKARELNPNDKNIVWNLAKLYEDNKNYEKAHGAYTKFYELSPQSLQAVEGLARNCYNLGSMYINRSKSIENKKDAEKIYETGLNYFRNSIPHLTNVINTKPDDLAMLNSLASVYATLGEERSLATTNSRILALGGNPISLDDYAGPAFMAAEGLDKEREAAALARQQAHVGGTDNVKVIADYQEYARKYIQSKFDKWKEKDQFETTEEYTKRCSKENVTAMQKQWNAEAEKNYIETYASLSKIRNSTLDPYDADHGTFLIRTEYGDIVLAVPNTNNKEAVVFMQSWAGMKFKNPVYKVVNNKIAIAQLTFETPAGKQYIYNDQNAANYAQVEITVDTGDFDPNQLARKSNQQVIEKKNITLGQSDVDNNIPKTTIVQDNTYALIICNEHYDEVAAVPNAINDGHTFSEYCELTLGIPKKNIMYREDATLNNIRMEIAKIKQYASTYSNPNDMNIIFYYSGHGVPDESTLDAYLVPKDGVSTMPVTCLKMSELYKELGGTNAGNITVFLDACYSGATRDGGTMFAGARAVALKAKPAAPVGNMVIFSATSSDETAMPYKEKSHGMFTYFLLKKLQESKGDVTLGELGDYLKENVKRSSIRVNNKEQNPQVNPSHQLMAVWQTLKLRNKK